jgi:hypothetical protein
VWSEEEKASGNGIFCWRAILIAPFCEGKVWSVHHLPHQLIDTPPHYMSPAAMEIMKLPFELRMRDDRRSNQHTGRPSDIEVGMGSKECIELEIMIQDRT